MINVYDEGFSEGVTYKQTVEDVFDTVCGLFGERDLQVELTLCDEETIREVNNAERGVDKVTDVLSFPTLDGITFPIDRERYADDVDMETGELMLGEILVCVKRCHEQGEEYGHGFLREFAYLITHGMLHLLGYDHMVEEDKQKMRAREEEVSSKLNIVR